MKLIFTLLDTISHYLSRKILIKNFNYDQKNLLKIFEIHESWIIIKLD